MIGKYYKASSDENSLCHSRSHMYIKREGTPGHYRYYYNTDTTESASSDSKVSDEYRNELSYNSQKNSFPKSSSSTTSEKVKENFSKSPSQAANDFINRHSTFSSKTTSGGGSSSSNLGGNILERMGKAIEKGKQEVDKFFSRFKTMKIN